MSRRVLITSLCLYLIAAATPALAAPPVRLGLKDVIALAHRDAPAPRVARARAEEGRSLRVGARLRSTENPVVEANVGPRWATERSTDFDVSLLLPLRLGPARSRRIQVAEAERKQIQLLARDSIRTSAGDAVGAYFRILHAQRRVALATERHSLAMEAEQIAKDRQKAGDISQFEVDLARGEIARSLSSVAAEKALLLRREADLRVVLGIERGRVITVAGDLGGWDQLGLDDDRRSSARPDLEAARREVDIARAEMGLARTSRLPDVALRFSYAREEDVDIGLVGLSLSLPVLNRGQGEAARAEARETRARIELEEREGVAWAEIEGARESFHAFVDALVPLERDAIPAATANSEKAFESYRSGKVDLAAFLLIRREAIETRLEHLDRLLDASLAAVDLWVALGSPPP
jgi:cobalt-zinc-cadmium efflux system outer membrane protein